MADADRIRGEAHASRAAAAISNECRRAACSKMLAVSINSSGRWRATKAAMPSFTVTASPTTVQASARRFLPPVDDAALAAATVTTDMFTPRTITKFTGHLGGAIYGAPAKNRQGRTPLANLYLCGTDQGFLGIVGAMLSGISMANFHILQGK